MSDPAPVQTPAARSQPQPHVAEPLAARNVRINAARGLQDYENLAWSSLARNESMHVTTSRLRNTVSRADCAHKPNKAGVESVRDAYCFNGVAKERRRKSKDAEVKSKTGVKETDRTMRSPNVGRA